MEWGNRLGGGEMGPGGWAGALGWYGWARVGSGCWTAQGTETVGGGEGRAGGLGGGAGSMVVALVCPWQCATVPEASVKCLGVSAT